MRLREHPLFARQPNRWPPILTIALGIAHPVDEAGMLKRVLLGAGPKTKLFVFIEHGESGYMGTLHFEDSDLCVRAYDLLAENVGRPLREIGDLDVPPDLSN